MPRLDEPFFEELIEGLPEAILVVEKGHPNYVYVNAAAEALLGYTCAELLALGPADVSAPESVATLGELAAHLEQGGVWRGIWYLRRKDGMTVEIAGTAKRRVVEGRTLYQGLAQPIADHAQRSPFEPQPGARLRRALVNCVACGREVPGTARRRYCSEKCRQWAYYHRNIESQRARSRARQQRRTDAPEASVEPPSTMGGPTLGDQGEGGSGTGDVAGRDADA